MSNVRKSLFISFAEKYSQMLIQLVTSLVLARVLTPHDIGVFSVGAAIIAIAHTLRDFGVSNFLVQTKEINLQIVRTAFGLTFVTSVMIASAVLLSRDVVANFYQEPAIRDIMLLLGLNFFLIPFSSINIALLKREMRMDAIYKINIFSQIVQSVVAVILAFNGFGYMSLAWSGLAGILATVTGAAFHHTQYSFVLPSFKSSRKVLSFSLLSTLTSLMNEFSLIASDLIIGKTLNFTAVGIYSRASGLVSLVERATLEGIHPVILPYFSKQNRSGNQLKSYFVKSAYYQLSLVWPILGVVALITYPLIYVLYGPTWVAASTAASYLCLALAGRSWNYLISPALIASGKPGKLALAQSINQPIKLILIFHGALVGIEEVAKGLAVAEAIGTGIALIFLWRVIGFSVLDLLTRIIKALFITGLAIIAPLYSAFYFGDNTEHVLLRLAISGLGAGIGWILGLFITKHPLLAEFSKFLRSRYPSKLTSM